MEIALQLQQAMTRMAGFFKNGFEPGYDPDFLGEVLDPLAQPGTLRELAARAAGQPALLRRSETNPVLTKYCLAYDADMGIEIRLNHYHLDTYDLDSVHDHKWPFASKILLGKVNHMLFRTSSCADTAGMFVTSHGAGDCYYLGGDFFHSFVPTPGAVTLMVRGPAVRQDWTRVELTQGAPVIKSTKELLGERRTLTQQEYLAFNALLDTAFG